MVITLGSRYLGNDGAREISQFQGFYDVNKRIYRSSLLRVRWARLYKYNVCRFRRWHLVRARFCWLLRGYIVLPGVVLRTTYLVVPLYVFTPRIGFSFFIISSVISTFFYAPNMPMFSTDGGGNWCRILKVSVSLDRVTLRCVARSTTRGKQEGEEKARFLTLLVADVVDCEKN